MTWLLVLYFTCAWECGYPTHVTFRGYASQEACNNAGSVWMSSAANPTQALRGFGCYQRSTSPVSSYRD
jgi:hypothetical protein